MSDNLLPEPTASTEVGNPTTVTNVSGGVNINAQGDVNISGDVVGRDKIIQTITNIFQGDTTQRDLRNRHNMLELVRNTWIEGVLEKSLYHEVMLDLGLEERPNEVQRPWDMTLQMPDCKNRALPPSTKIMQVFDNLNHALLILGEPGSGKTTMLLELARDTIARAEQDPTQPIPVVFNLSSWSADPKKSIADWLVKELTDKYTVSKKTARPWIENDELLLLLDGLDEVKAEHREACVRAINDFRAKHGQTQLAVCSRIADYEVLATQLKLQGAVLIQPLTEQQTYEYLERGGAELAAVREVLRHDTELQELAQSPLMLGIMSLAYSGRSADYLTPILEDSTQRRKHLLDAYMDKMFARIARIKYEPYSNDDTVRGLTWLAERMSEHGQTVFLVEGMQPSWLPSSAQRMIYLISYWLVIGPAVGLIFGQAYGPDVVLVLGLTVWYFGWKGRIEPAESLKLRWSRLLVWLVACLLLCMALGLITKQLTTGLYAGLILGLVMGLVSGLTAKPIGTKTKPNQGIWLSGRNALFIGLLGGLLVIGFVSGLLISGLVGGLPIEGLMLGLFCGLFVGLNVGGYAFIKHFWLRFILWRNGDIPRNYVHFLDYAAERIFLRKVGGGYIFIHRMLMEYFASLEMQPSAEGKE